MNRKNCTDKMQLDFHDGLNNVRLETTRKRVAHAIQILKPATWCTYETDEQKAKLKTDIAHAVNLLESAAEEMTWHCEWFDYNNSVVIQIDDACDKLGQAMAEMFEDEYDIVIVTADVKDACVFLAKALATLIRWNDPDQDVSEV